MPSPGPATPAANPRLPSSAGGFGRIVLRPLQSVDVAELLRWDLDRDLVDLFGGPPSDPTRLETGYVLAVEAAGRFIGIIGLTGDTWAMRSAELRILLGNRADWGKGLGREAIAAFLAHVFEATTLDFIYLRVFRRNQRAIRCYTSCGFQPAGRLRVRFDSRYADPPLADDLLLMTLVRPAPGGAETTGEAAAASETFPGRYE